MLTYLTFHFRKLQAVMLLLLLSIAATSHAEWFDGVIISGGNDFSSNANLNNYRVSVFQTWDARWFNEGDWYIGGYYDLSINRWKSKLSNGPGVSVKGQDHINAIAFSPVFRIARKSPWFGTVVPFAEAGIGLSYLSGSTLKAKNEKPVNLGIRLQFEDRIGFGFQFGKHQQFQVILRAFHYSNAGLHANNNGVNLQEIAFGWSF
ncbi:acyloxyacyl hydrolase [Sansalvadorimonas verongulae]|uniref:acyloxyacyl hydrolase n=1 Tax=Sansalvadorimonas verongulae TaxID=2172824 RepID=UPI0012BCD293|nr:acyloxyacyl hydrolase [Sansalvadorimonas verongulae]MTI14217.1 acyloxyacyl hydrolase [Sansalvadorimonas verongulae]